MNTLLHLTGNPLSNVLGLVFYLIIGFSLYTIAQKEGKSEAWFAFIPILNLVLLFQLVDMPVWYVVFIIVPCIGWLALWVFYMIAWSKVAEKCGKPSFWGFLAGLPVLHVVAPAVIAFT